MSDQSAPQDLETLTKLVYQFNGLASILVDTNEALQRKYELLVSFDEIEGLLDLVEDIDGNFDEPGSLSDDDLRTSLKANELGMAFLSRVLSTDEILAEIPEALKNQDAADALRQLGAETVAELCELSITP